MSDSRIESRRAIEALRCGVPNQDAVRALGSGQAALEGRFRSQLKDARESVAAGSQTPGILVAGDFGSGKSHLLERFQGIALEENFVCSKIVVSKETPLYDPAKVYRAAMESAAIPGIRGSALREIATGLRFDGASYADFFKWVNEPGTRLSSHFAATLYVYEYGRGDEEVRDRIVRFWSGEKLGVAELKKWLRDLGEAATYKIDKVTIKELAVQRQFFFPRLAIAAGYSGWVLLIDEVELIGRYSLRQRARSYAEIARWIGRLEGFGVPGLTSVLTITSDFEREVLDEEKNDEEKIPNKLRGSGSEADILMAAQAERGMQVIRRDRVLLEKPDNDTMRQTFQKVRAIYSSAYGWEPPNDYKDVEDPTLRMRQNVKRWITEWDLMRLYPGYRPSIEVGQLRPSYEEMPDIEVPTEGSTTKADAAE